VEKNVGGDKIVPRVAYCSLGQGRRKERMFYMLLRGISRMVHADICVVFALFFSVEIRGLGLDGSPNKLAICGFPRVHHGVSESRQVISIAYLIVCNVWGKSNCSYVKLWYVNKNKIGYLFLCIIYMRKNRMSDYFY